MSLHRRLLLLLVLASWFASPPSACGQAGSVARGIAEALLEKLSQKGARDLAEAGGEKMVREAIEKAAVAGGEPLAREAAILGERYGAQALRAIGEAPAAMVQAMRHVPAEFAEGAMRAAAREPQVVAKLAERIGEDALIVAAKHPGVGVNIATKLGSEGCAVAKNLATSDAIRLARFSDDLAALPGAERAGVLARIKSGGAKVLDYLERHPNTLKTAALTATALVAIDELLGDAKAPGFIERITGQFSTPVSLILCGVAVLFLARAIWWFRRARKPSRT